MGPYLAQPEVKKKTSQGSNKEMSYASSEMQGWRKTMEDADIMHTDFAEGMSLFAVFDGHGGHEVSKFVAKFFTEELMKNKNFKKGDYSNALIENFKKMDEMLESAVGAQELQAIRESMPQDNYYSGDGTTMAGCTANVLLITPDKYYVANAGDSRAVLSRSNSAVPLSEDHKPDDPIEIDRINKAGGYIVNGRVNGGLNLTRSIGDFQYKKQTSLPYDQQLIICKPDVKVLQRNKKEDQFVIMGCDGIWEKYVSNNQGMVEWVHGKVESGEGLDKVVEGLLDFLLAKETSEEVGCDNMTAILIQFKR